MQNTVRLLLKMLNPRGAELRCRNCLWRQGSDHVLVVNRTRSHRVLLNEHWVIYTLHLWQEADEWQTERWRSIYDAYFLVLFTDHYLLSTNMKKEKIYMPWDSHHQEVNNKSLDLNFSKFSCCSFPSINYFLPYCLVPWWWLTGERGRSVHSHQKAGLTMLSHIPRHRGLQYHSDFNFWS